MVPTRVSRHFNRGHDKPREVQVDTDPSDPEKRQGRTQRRWRRARSTLRQVCRRLVQRVVSVSVLDGEINRRIGIMEESTNP